MDVKLYHGWPLCPMLFLIFMDNISAGVRPLWEAQSCISAVLLGSSEHDLQHAVEQFAPSAGMKASTLSFLEILFISD